jgi:hypothetical protein
MIAFSKNKPLAAIVVVSVVVRLAAALYLGDVVEVLPGTYDQISYDALAQNVAAGRGFVFDQPWYPFTPPNTPTAHWSFLYTGYLAAIYAVVGHHPIVARLLQALIVGLLMPILLYRIARRTFGGAQPGAGHTIGLVAAAAHTFYIYLVYYAATLMTEPFYILAIVWSLDLLQRLDTRSSWGGASAVSGEEEGQGQGDTPPLSLAIQLGLAWAIAVLLRQQILLLIPIFLLWLLWAARPRVTLRFLVRFALVPLLIVAAFILPFTIRNYLVYDAFLPLNSNVGWALYAANHPIQGTRFEPRNLPAVPPEYAGLNEAQLNTRLTADGIGFVLDEPGRFALQTLDRFRNYFRFWPEPTSSTIANVSRVLSFGLYLPFMLYGLYLSVRHLRTRAPTRPVAPSPPHLILLYLYMLTYTAIHLLSWAMHRYRLPVDAVLMVFVGLALVDLYHRLPTRVRERSRRILPM